MKNLSDWLCDLTWTNIDGDGVTTVERKCYIFHRTAGLIVVFLDLFSEDLTNRIQYPFKQTVTTRKQERKKDKFVRRTSYKETRTGGARIVLKDPLTLAKNCF